MVTILSEVNEPACNLAVSKAACLLGAQTNVIVDKLMWEQDYNGRIFSAMSDVIFVSTGTHMCLFRFAQKSSVPVLCMKSRTHATIQSLATMMTMQVEPVSPLLYKQSEIMCSESQTCMKRCECIDEVLTDANVIIAGPTTKRKEKTDVFRFTKQDAYKGTPDWIFFHCCPRGEEISDDLFCNYNARTFDAFENMPYITAALMAKAVKGHVF
ncbi:Ornithine carbamoyltransferase [Eumeta japonica]|uniref:ornithine carbamoyltransferase n=1 Tax=Eumeta variegata TaxID=151549 RepID=A0A4C1TT08_EUMVA|nr:Ornithine carbamoyltransferase [Eumeta japonica]